MKNNKPNWQYNKNPSINKKSYSNNNKFKIILNQKYWICKVNL